MKTFKHYRIFIFAFALSACSGNFSTGTITERSSYPKVIQHAKKDKWYLMLHSGVNIYTVNSVELDKPKQHMTVQLDKPDSLHQVYVNNPETKPYKPKPELSELHIYMMDSVSYTLDEPHTLLLDKVAKIESLK